MLLVFDSVGETAAFYFEQLVSENSEIDLSIVKFDERHWNDSRYTNEGEISDFTLFIGNIKSTEPIKKFAKIRFSKYGIKYSISGKKAVLTANPRSLLKSKEEYDRFKKDLDIVAPNRINSCTHGIKKWEEIFLKGIRRIGIRKRAVEEQQLLYGVTLFFNNELRKFIGDEIND